MSNQQQRLRFAVTGITGQVGGAVARTLLAAGHTVRAVVRDAEKGKAWAQRGCEVALADVNDAAALQAAFTSVDGVFILLPPTFDPSNGFPEAAATIKALHTALDAVRPSRVVGLSTIGAQAKQTNLLTQLQMLEQSLGRLPVPVAFLRAGWFMENAAWDVEPAATSGIIQSYLQPLDKPFPMVATADVGRVAAELLQQEWTGRKVVELEGPQRITPNELAETFAKVLGQPVRAVAIPRDEWEVLFKKQGMSDPTPRIRMLEGFNEGWIEFEGGETGSIKGSVTLETILRKLVAQQT
ncbi:NmrA family NAD(P)-binding protein [Fimbriiglobus ruber]|uniref:NmrA-like domain-containing protein n=1 Tax=Fimbriiglobus ruber TaxID=1908690 RepID=A0A225D642_9BACT|nr:NmrA family NAD(P)-binding protein [Fimbriiglobus ruber]OWK35104.1 hypothetical protein FRUB_09946 [Fimbriiglobus ruber]